MTTPTYTITAPDPAADRATGSALLAQAESLTVTDAPSLDAAGAFLRSCAAAKKAVEARLKPAVEAAHAAHRELTSLRSDLCAPFDRARAVVEPRVVAYQRAEQDRLDSERREAEARARKVAEEAQLAAALDAESAGHDDAAEAILSEAPILMAVPAASAPKVAGVSRTVRYSARVVDFAALVASGRLELLLPNQSALDAMARALKGAVKIPGVEIVTTESLSVRS